MLGGIFWGTAIILFGISVIIEALFGFSIPVFKIFIGCLLIYWGLKFILGKDVLEHEYHSSKFSTKYSKSHEDFYDYHEQFVKDKNFRLYKVIFSQRVIDLRKLEQNLDTEPQPQVIKIDSVGSNTLIKIDPNIKTKIKISSAFSSVEFPDKTQVYFGSHVYKTDNLKDSKPELKIKVNSVFSKVIIENA